MKIKARKKPVEIEAIKFDGWNWRECQQFMSDEPLFFTQEVRYQEKIEIKTLEGVMTASVDDYIVKGVQGEFYPVKPDIFHETYDIIDDRKINIDNRQIEEFIDSNSPYYFELEIKKDLYTEQIEVVMSHVFLTLGQFYDEVNRLNILAEEQGLNIKMYVNR